MFLKDRRDIFGICRRTHVPHLRESSHYGTKCKKQSKVPDLNVLTCSMTVTIYRKANPDDKQASHAKGLECCAATMADLGGG